MYYEKYLPKISLLISVLLILIVVVSCAPPLTDEELEAELAKLTPEEREELVAELESKDTALAGQAVSASIATKYKLSTKVATVSKAKVIYVAKTRFQPTPICTPKTKAEVCILDQTCGDFLDGCGGVVQCGTSCGDLKKPHCQANKCVSGYEVTTESSGYIQPQLPSTDEPSKVVVVTSAYSLSEPVTSGRYITLTIKIKNVGQGDTPGSSFILPATLLDDQVVTDGDGGVISSDKSIKKLGEFNVPTLLAGEERSISATFPYPSGSNSPFCLSTTHSGGMNYYDQIVINLWLKGELLDSIC